ncbi:MAG: permease-like cell division protein FtsX [Bacteroidales bacterium]|nr:permease-like cell division protein FtsX [Bacteroidales bacterium]
MRNNNNNKSHGLWSASFSTTLSISLVMFLLGFIFLFIYHAYNVSNEIKEQVSFTVYLNSGTSTEEALGLEKEIQQNPKVKSTKYISPNEAAQMMNKIMGDNHLMVLDSINPYQASIEVNLKAQSLNITQIRQFILTVESKDIVDVVDYRHDLITDINNIIYNISAFIFVLFLCLLFIAVTLINHTIRLSISNKRLQIRSMELIGAKAGFIRRPFIAKGFMLGLIGSIVADVLLSGLLFWAYSSIGGLNLSDHIKIYIIIGVSIIILGTLLTLIFTSRSIRKNMNLKSSKLYR